MNQTSLHPPTHNLSDVLNVKPGAHPVESHFAGPFVSHVLQWSGFNRDILEEYAKHKSISFASGILNK